MNDEQIEERSYSVAVCYYTTHLGDIEYTVRVEEYAGRLHALGDHLKSGQS